MLVWEKWFLEPHAIAGLRALQRLSAQEASRCEDRQSMWKTRALVALTPFFSEIRLITKKLSADSRVIEGIERIHQRFLLSNRLTLLTATVTSLNCPTLN